MVDSESLEGASITAEGDRGSDVSERALSTKENLQPESVRISVRLSQSARQALEEIMQMSDISTIQDAVRRCINDELFLMRERAGGWKVLLHKGNKYREVYWP